MTAPARQRTAWLGAVWLLRFAAAFLLLNLLLTFENRWPGLGVRSMPRLSFELCLGVLALTGWVAWRGGVSARAASWLAVGALLCGALRYIDVTAQAVFGRPLNLFWDGAHAADVLELALQSVAWWQIAAALALMLLGLGVLYRLARWAIATLAECLAWRAPRPVLLTAGLALTLSFAAYQPGRDTRWFFSLPLSPTVAHQLAMLPAALWPERSGAALSSSPAFTGNVARLHGADVLLLFAESYGVTSLDDPAKASALQAAREHFAQAVQASGRSMVSARVRSPTFGGASWLAHAGLLSGVDTHDPHHNDLLLASQRPTLVRHFALHGYRTVGWMPGLQRPWPEGSFYGFDRVAGANDIGYAGPAFGYWRVPDQAAMALLHAQELAGAVSERAPRFIVFPTLNTHAPFRPLPPYLADWSRAARADAYNAEQYAAALAAEVSWQNAALPYIDSLRYQFDWLAGYLSQRAPRKLVLIVVGDHQPLAAVSGPNAS
ncbi:MAG TPA: hypothetical protein VHQ87_13565, partial [Rhizobacter sp.]|nr:hypothetical protein [Rhizobacter sp.]